MGPLYHNSNNILNELNIMKMFSQAKSICHAYNNDVMLPETFCKYQVTLCFYNIIMIYISNPKQSSCKKECGPQKGYGEKRCEIQGGGQEMAVIVG